MDENKSITYDDLIQTRNTQILKSIVPYLDVPTQKPLATAPARWLLLIPTPMPPWMIGIFAIRSPICSCFNFDVYVLIMHVSSIYRKLFDYQTIFSIWQYSFFVNMYLYSFLLHIVFITIFMQEFSC